MDIKMNCIIKQIVGEKIYYWGQDCENQVYLLNKYSKLKQMLQLFPNFKQDNYNIFQTLWLTNDQLINIPRKSIIRITHAEFSLN